MLPMMDPDGEFMRETNPSVMSFEQLQAQYQTKIEAYARLAESYKIVQYKLSQAKSAIEEWQDRASFYEQRHKDLILQISKYLQETTNYQDADPTSDCSVSSDDTLRLALNRMTESESAASTDTELAKATGKRGSQEGSKSISNEFKLPLVSGTRGDQDVYVASEKLSAGYHSRQMDNFIRTSSQSISPASRAPAANSGISSAFTENAVTLSTTKLSKNKDAATSRSIGTQSLQKNKSSNRMTIKNALQTRAVDRDVAYPSQNPLRSSPPDIANLSNETNYEKMTTSFQTANSNAANTSQLLSRKRKKQVDLGGFQQFAEDDGCSFYSDRTSNTKCRLEQLLKEQNSEMTRLGHNQLRNPPKTGAECDDSTDSSGDHRAPEMWVPTAASRETPSHRGSDCLIMTSRRNRLTSHAHSNGQTENIELVHITAMRDSGEDTIVTGPQLYRTSAPSNQRCNHSREDVDPPEQHAIRSRTPPGIWDTGMPDTQKLQEQQRMS